MRRWIGSRRCWTVLGLVALVLVMGVGWVELAEARPGGGESYGSSSSSGGGGGGGELIGLLFELWLHLIIRYPQVGVPLTIVFLVIAWRVQSKKAQGGETWDSAPAPPPRVPDPPKSRSLEPVREIDPEFSPVLFEDFAYALYAKAHEARARPKDLEALSPYLSPGVREHLAGRWPVGREIATVVIGAMRCSLVYVPQVTQQDVRVTLEFEANLSPGGEGGDQTHYVRERWMLRRSRDARSRPPEAIRDFGCPSCGAPYLATPDNRCSYCDEVVTDGRFEWLVDNILLLDIESRPPALRGTVPERGTQLPTIYQSHIDDAVDALFADDPALTVEDFGARFGLIFHDLNGAWSARDLGRARPFLSDALFDYLQFWIEAYKAQGLRNVLEGFRIQRWEFVKVSRDKYYDAITLRFWGIGRDSTVEISSGNVVGGNPRQDRPYSEYWTFIRGRGVRGKASAERSCPNCGVGLDINMAGVCTHCQSKVTRGDFDWVLSKIEQDEAYGG